MKAARIKNFQAHKDVKLRFSPQITTIVGPSDKGKSSLLRALIWALTNKPRGDAFIKIGERDCEVRLLVEDGLEVLRKRGPGTNLYKLNDNEFEAFHNDVPSDIADALNITDLNIQQQHDAPFWFTESAGEVSRQLNEIVDLSSMDTAMSFLNAEVRKNKSQVNLIKERKGEMKREGARLKWTVGAHKELMAVEASEFAWEQKQERTARLGELVNAVDQHRRQGKSKAAVLKQARAVLLVAEVWRNSYARENALRAKVQALEKLNAEADKTALPVPAELVELSETLERTAVDCGRLSDLIEKTQTIEERLCRQKNEFSQENKRLKKLVGNTCPICGRSGTKS